MTEKQEKLVKEMFTGCGVYGGYGAGKIDVRGFFFAPEKINETSFAAREDESAAQTIKEMQKAIEMLEAYRIALAERYQYLAAAPTARVVRLDRERKSLYGKDAGKVFYYLRLYDRRVDDGVETELKIDNFPHIYAGKDRHQALKDFDNYIKSHPGIEAHKNIEKSPWEH